MPLRDWFAGLWGKTSQAETDQPPVRGPATHVIILDGTMSSLARGYETNAGLTYKLIKEAGVTTDLTLYYEAGIQWQNWRSVWDVAAGRGINRQIMRAYGVLASRFRAGDRIVLMGFSRGAYAVRSLAGVIDMVGLVRAEHATERNIATAYRHYRAGATSEAAAVFWNEKCHPQVGIEAVGVWDTVKSLGLVAPVLWRLTAKAHAFHNHHLGHVIRHGYQALALHETRVAYRPVLWDSTDDWDGHVEQVWFQGCHGDVGGELKGFAQARPLSNIPLVWMLEKMAAHGVVLPGGWQARFAQDARAPSRGNWRGTAKLFVTRRRRLVGRDPSEQLHPSVPADDRFAAPILRAGTAIIRE